MAQTCQPVPISITLTKGLEHPPVYKLVYPTSEVKLEKLFEVLSTLGKEDVLEEIPRGSEGFLSPGMANGKGNGEVRFVVNLKAVNARAVVIADCRKHSVEDWWRRLPSWSRYYCCMDVRNAFFTLPVEETSRQYLHTSIWTKNGYKRYMWKRMPQGFCNSSSHWIHHIERCISSLEDYISRHPQYSFLLERTLILAYADDILVCGRTEMKTTEMETSSVRSCHI